MEQGSPNNLAKNIGRFQRLLIVFWTVALLASLGWNIESQRRTAIEVAKYHARAFFEKDLLGRRWNALHSPVYVPISATTPPNPYLSNIPERDITTPSGRRLTLINPTYMTRQIHELAAGSGIAGHITSLRPLRPENRPDIWEATALRRFEEGEKEVVSVTVRDDKKYLRLMRPLLAEKACLFCHGQQGYKEGMIRGGISVEVPVLLDADFWHSNIALFIGHFFLWVLGLAGIFLAGHKLTVSLKLRLRAEEKLAEANKNLELKVAERTAELRASRERFRSLIMEMPSSFALHEIICDDRGQPCDYRFLQVNRSFEKALGLTEQEIIGKRVLELLPNTEPEWIETYGKVALSGKPVHFEKYSEELQRYFDVHAFSTTPGEFAAIFSDISKRKKDEADREKLLAELEASLAQVKKISGMLPICANCKKIRDDKGYWQQVEIYLRENSEADFSHGICPECASRLYPEFYEDKKSGK